MAPAPRKAPAGTPLYVHLPFCVAKCTYCDFFSLPAEGQDLAGVVDAILQEARGRAPEAPRTVFLGGGTPSLFEPALLQRLLDGLDDLTGFRSSAAEVTAECNPESLDVERATCLLELGVDRLSIGVQALHAPTLELFGRVHAPEDGLRALADARSAGCERLSADLIYAWPGQTVEGWERDLRRVLAQGPDHLSAYNLTFEPETLLARWREQGRVKSLDEELELALFETVRRVANEKGLGAYEVSNYALDGQQCEHNVNYWHNGAYLGLGPSAVSKLAYTRSGNPRSLASWRKSVEAGEDPREWEETPSPGLRLGETWWLGLRLASGVEPARARRTAGWSEAADPALALARELEGDELLTEIDGSWRLTPSGLPLADAIASRFLDVCARTHGATEHPAPRTPGESSRVELARLADSAARPGEARPQTE